MRIFGKKGASGFSASSTAEQVTRGVDGTGLTAIVTGASSGIGVETVRVLALRGVHVVMAVRNMDAGANVKEAILKKVSNAKIDVMELDLSSMASVRKFAAEYNSKCLPLNILINNAGVMVGKFKLSQDNIELDFATNHLGHFLLTNLLLENMKQTSRNSNIEGRIVNVSSLGHRYTYREGIRFDLINDKSRFNNYVAYAESKLANILHANELTRRLKEERVEITANSLHPGTIHTNIVRNDIRLKCLLKLVRLIFLSKTIQQGAATTCFLALNPQVKGVSGEYYVDCNIAKPRSKANDPDLAKRLWDFSLSLTDLKKGPSGFSASSTAEEVTQGIDGTGLTAIVTGATSGLGLETSRVLALRGVHVVMAVRNTSAGKNVKEAILKEIPSARVDVMELDLSLLASVRKFGEDYNSLGLPLTILIYYKYLAYGQSKLANVLHANELSRRLKEEGTQITANSLHPGSIQTNIVRIDDGILYYIAKVLSVFIMPFMKTIQQGAATTCFVALHPQVKGVSGEYFADCNIAKPSDQAKDADLATKLWDFSLSLTDLK
ncbi:hypothetical protein ACLB2K_043631 [Fragaria x ananassa]